MAKSIPFPQSGLGRFESMLSEISAQPIDWRVARRHSEFGPVPIRLTIVETADLINATCSRAATRCMHTRRRDHGQPSTATMNRAWSRRCCRATRQTPQSLLRPQRMPRTAGWFCPSETRRRNSSRAQCLGKLTALATTKRSEAMDAAVNSAQVAS